MTLRQSHDLGEVWQHRYKDITSVSPLGRFLLDYTKFHDTVREE
jgi:hypothetical protein